MTDEQYWKLMESSGWSIHCMSEKERAETGIDAIGVRSLANNPNYVKCPRCWHYTHEGISNYDSLCDRCCRGLLNHWPDHESVPHIRENWQKQGFLTRLVGVEE